jgi:PAS domain-containing protein
MAAPHTRPMGMGMKLMARRKDGTEFPVDVMLSTAATPQGNLVIAILRDITERQKSIERIQSLLERVQLSADAAKMGYWTFDEATEEFWCDQICASLFGGRTEDFPDIGSVRQRIFPEDREERRRQALESIRLKGG